MVGAWTIIGIDANPAKFLPAKSLGADECINPKDFAEPIHQVIVDMTDGSVD